MADVSFYRTPIRARDFLAHAIKDRVAADGQSPLRSLRARLA
ncbi:hypothetical protein [Parerythrobacter jejuensis]|nr:hypothetical protein [Parerythrobacter jejuensis]